MVKLALYDYRRDSTTCGIINEIFMGERCPRAVYIPPGIFHGTKNTGRDVAVVIGMPSLLYMILKMLMRDAWTLMIMT